MFDINGSRTACEGNGRIARPSHPAGRRRVAALEVGERSCGLLAAECIDREHYRVLERVAVSVATGPIGSDGRFVAEAAPERLWGALKRLGRLAMLREVDEIVTLATPSLALEEGFLLVMSDAMGAHLTLLDDVDRARLNGVVGSDLLSCADPRLLMLDLGSESAGLMVLDEGGEKFSTSAWLGRPGLLAEAPFARALDRAARARLALRIRALVQPRLARAMRHLPGQVLVLSPLASTIRRLTLLIGALDTRRRGKDVISLPTLRHLEEELLGMTGPRRRSLVGEGENPEEVLWTVMVARTVLEEVDIEGAALRAPSVLDAFMGEYLKTPAAPSAFARMAD